MRITPLVLLTGLIGAASLRAQAPHSGWRAEYLNSLNGAEKKYVSLAEATVRAGWEGLRTTESSVLLEAVTAYLDVVRDQAILTLRENNVTVLTRDLSATQARFQAGEVTRTDVEQAKARRAGAVAALDLARANLKTSRAIFERVIGHPPSKLIEPRPSTLVPKGLGDSTEIASRESPRSSP